MTNTGPTEPTVTSVPIEQYDVVIIGAGVAGLYQLYRIRQLGLSVALLLSPLSVPSLQWRGQGDPE